LNSQKGFDFPLRYEIWDCARTKYDAQSNMCCGTATGIRASLMLMNSKK